MSALPDEGTSASRPRELSLDEWQRQVEDSIAAALDWLPEDALERLRRRCLTPSARRRRRLELRDDAVRSLAAHYAAESGRDLAGAIEHDLALYRAAGRHRGAPPEDPRRRLLHQVIRLSGARALGWRQIFRILSGKPCVENSTDHDTPGGA